MLLASNIGFLALVAPAQIFYALSFDPQRGIQSPEEYKSFMIQGNIYQCLINTYYAASFVFCFASSSVFRREIKKLLQRQYKPKHSINHDTNNVSYLTNEHERRSFLHPRQASGPICSSSSRIHEYALEKPNQQRRTQSTVDYDACVEK